MNRSIFIVCFFVVSVLNILALVFSNELAFACTKPLIMLSLIAHYVKVASVRSGVFLFALFFCLAGDVFLLFSEQHELFFMAGLLAFLAGHVLYIRVYRQCQLRGFGEELLTTQKIRFALPVVLAGTGLITILYPRLGALQIPVIIYAIVLMIMVIAAMQRYGKTTAASYGPVLLGAILFMVSDSMLAVNKFLHPFYMAPVAIMISYIAAQYFIVQGILAHPVRR